YCQNFEFFDVNPDGIESGAIKGLTQQIFEAQLEVALLIREKPESTEEQRLLAETYIDGLHHLITSLDKDRFVVKAEMRAVVEFSDKARWSQLNKSDRLAINTHLSTLILPNKNDDELARRFDILILNYQLALLTAAYSTDRYIHKISSTAKLLLKKQNIPAVATHINLLNELQTELFWKAITINRLENMRVSLRDLMKYLVDETQDNFFTSFEDTLNIDDVIEYKLMPTYSALQSYKERVESYIRNHKDHLIIQKIKTNKPITGTEINALEGILFNEESIGSKQDYQETYGEKPLGEFIRGIVGLDVAAAQAAFADFIQAGNLRADQVTFINNIISYLTTNGMIDKKMLFEAP
ncbi:MAG: hypothetical protein KAG10_02210, partial [Methylococcales bacterium]|nr:hypothetical protein [Methylococcales bacterium]